MKKFVLLLGLLFALQMPTLLRAQVAEDNGNVVFNAHLLETFNLNVDGITQEITFALAADYNAGVIEGGGILPGTTAISVEATDIWNLTIECPDFVPGGANPGTNTIPIDNLGVYCASTGTHTFGAEVTCTYVSTATIAGLTNAPFQLIGNGTGNAGDVSDNAFTLHWEMGTMRNVSMHATSMFDQLASGTSFTTGDYTTTAVLTLYSLP
jgi:hypothetical protein